MADNFRYRYGETSPVQSKPVPTATLVAVGDIVTDTPGPASDVDWDTDIATTQEAVHDAFLGVSGRRSRAGDTDEVRVATKGVFEFDCASATFDVGDLVGVAKATGNAVENQKVVAVSAANLAIGRVVEQHTAATTKVKVEIVSTIVHGGPQAAA